MVTDKQATDIARICFALGLVLGLLAGAYLYHLFGGSS